MTTTHKYGTATCKTCGAPFAASRAGYTVNCPPCRGKDTPAPTPKKVADTAPAAGAPCTVTASGGHICGKPAVTAFTGSDGFVYAECAAHAPGGAR